MHFAAVVGEAVDRAERVQEFAEVKEGIDVRVSPGVRDHLRSLSDADADVAKISDGLKDVDPVALEAKLNGSASAEPAMPLGLRDGGSSSTQASFAVPADPLSASDAPVTGVTSSCP